MPQMPEIYKSIIAGLARWLIVFFAGYVGVTWTEKQTSDYAAALAVVLLMLLTMGWSTIENVKLLHAPPPGSTPPPTTTVVNVQPPATSTPAPTVVTVTPSTPAPAAEPQKDQPWVPPPDASHSSSPPPS